MWEFHTVTVSTNTLEEVLHMQLNALGSLGWETVGLSAADPTIGTNRIIVLLKRRIAPWPSPAGSEGGWHPDPTGRFATRYWDGLRWTEHVSDGTTQTTDFPNRR